MGMVFKSFETFDNKFIIDFNDELREKIREFTPFEELPSYNIICARVLGTSYANFLRWARDNYNGIIYGKGNKYPIIKFNNVVDCDKCCTFLTKRLNGLE